MKIDVYTAVLLATLSCVVPAKAEQKVVEIDWENHWFSAPASQELTDKERELQVSFLNCETDCITEFNPSGTFPDCQTHALNTSGAYECIGRCIVSFRTDAEIAFPSLSTTLSCLPAASCDQSVPCSVAQICENQFSQRGNRNILTDAGINNCVLSDCNALPAPPVFDSTGPECIRKCQFEFPRTSAGSCDDAETYFVEQALCFEDCTRRFRLDVFPPGFNLFPTCLSAAAYTCSTEEFCVGISGTNGIDQFPIFSECALGCTMNCIEFVEVQAAVLAAQGNSANQKRDNILDSSFIFLIHICVTLVAFFIATN